MRFQSTSALAALVAITSSSIAFAQDAGAQYSSDLLDYITATLVTESAFLAIETNSADVSALMAIQTMDLSTDSPAQLSSVVAGLPTEVQSLATSILNVVSSIASKDGFTTSGGMPMPSSMTMTSDSASATNAGVVGGAATSDSTSTESSSTSSRSTSATSSSASSTGTSGASMGGMDMGLFAGSLVGVVGIVAAL